MDSINKTSPIKIFRFTFSDYILERLKKFSIIHKHDDRKDFKENWELWVKQNEGVIQRETSRLELQGYKGDVTKKMFVSVRYYFRKKSNMTPEVKERRKYIKLETEILKLMDDHIKESLEADQLHKPSKCYDEFIIEYKDSHIIREIRRIIDIYSMGKEEVCEKFKKTYKNRFFNLLNK